MNLPTLSRPLALLASAVVLASALHAKVTETIKQSFPLAANGTISLANVNGSVEITAWDKAEVALEAEKSAPDAEQLQLIQVLIDAQPDRLSIKTEHGKLHHGSFWIGSRSAQGDVRYKLRVPAGVTLAKVEVVNADVRCTGVQGPVSIATVNGTINATGLAAPGRFDTVNGTVNVAYARVPADGRIVLDTVNGSCHLAVPKDAGFQLDADNLNGSVECTLPIKLEKSGRHHLRGVVGNGGAQVKLDSVNGSLHLTAN